MDLWAILRTFLLYSCLLVFHSRAAGTFRGLSGFGSVSMERTLTTMDSIVCTGNHLSCCNSYSCGSLPGWWRIEMQTLPDSASMFGCHIGHKNLIVGGEFGKSSGNLTSVGNMPPSKGVPGGPMIVHLQVKMSSLTKPHEK